MKNPTGPDPRSSALRIAIFNHKGGVGKSTLTVNLAQAMAEQGRRVLLVDSDPQCNLTSYLVEEAVVDDLLDHSDLDNGATLWSGVKPIVEGMGEVRAIPPLQLPNGVSLIPGDIRLAEFEAELTPFWGEMFQRRSRGFRGTTGLSQLVNTLSQQHSSDVVFYDTGPNIGALNRVILLDCDFFIIPAACDLFSLRAIKTLGHTLSSWIQDWNTVADLAPDDVYLLPGVPRLVGYVPQRFRVYGGQPSYAYSQLLPRIERCVQEDVVAILKRIDPALVSAAIAPLQLAEIQDFGTLANAAQQQGVALWNAAAGTPSQRENARVSFDAFARIVLSRIGL